MVYRSGASIEHNHWLLRRLVVAPTIRTVEVSDPDISRNVGLHTKSKFGHTTAKYLQ
jgi:hypothetical protein